MRSEKEILRVMEDFGIHRGDTVEEELMQFIYAMEISTNTIERERRDSDGLNQMTHTLIEGAIGCLNDGREADALRNLEVAAKLLKDALIEPPGPTK